MPNLKIVCYFYFSPHNLKHHEISTFKMGKSFGSVGTHSPTLALMRVCLSPRHFPNLLPLSCLNLSYEFNVKVTTSFFCLLLRLYLVMHIENLYSIGLRSINMVSNL